jgi:L-type amino acid transporter 9
MEHATTSSAASDADVPAEVTDTRKLTFRHGFAILVSIQIGSGIFSSPAQIDSNAPSPAAALSVWVLSGLLSWAGAASFAELGTVIPRSGGMQEHLRYVYGDAVSAVMAWTWILAAKPSSIAIQGIVLGESIGSAIGYPNNPAFTIVHLRVIAVLALLFVYILNLRSTMAPAKASEVFTAVKFITVGGIAVGGLAVLMYHYLGQNQCHEADWCSRSWFQYRNSKSGDSDIDWSKVSWWQMSGHFSAAIYAGLWAHSGWDNVSLSSRSLLNHS